MILLNNVMLAGHCKIGDYVNFGGGSAVHQFARIGAHAFIGGLAGVTEDLIPFGVVIGNRGRLAGVNVVGMKRRGFSWKTSRPFVAPSRRCSPRRHVKERVEQAAQEFAGNVAVE